MATDTEQGTVDPTLGDDGRRARWDMQARLLRALSWLNTLAAAGLALQESVASGPVLLSWVASLVALGTLLWSYRARAPLRALGLTQACLIVLLITQAALDFGGATAPSLSASFVPGFLAVLVLGPAWGWPVCGLMLLILATLGINTPLPLRYDRLRFGDEVAMAIFAAGLAHSLVRSFEAYDAAIAKLRATLVRLRDHRQTLAAAIYEELEPLAARLVKAVPRLAASARELADFERVLEQLTENLRRAQSLAQRDQDEPSEPEDADRQIRRRTMRVWFRLGAVFMACVVARNVVEGVAFVPSLFSIGFCLGFDFWLSRPASARYLELTALAIGLLATGPMIAHLLAYGVTPDAPALVITPGTVLFTALLSRGPSVWAIVVVNLGILAWAGVGQPLSAPQARLLGAIALSFVIVSLSLHYVLSLRARYTRTLLEQRRSVAETLRLQRRLAGTLFHDVNNHLLVLSCHVESHDAVADLTSAQSLSRRIERLILLSKEFLLSPGPQPELTSVSVGDALSLLTEAFAPRLAAKQLRLSAGPGLELSARAQPELLVESVLGNLLSNAVKFSPRGSQITLRAERAGPEVRIVLRDSGPGLPDHVLHRLGREGAVPSTVGTAGELGQGFGLQLAEEHLQRMGGRLELSTPSGGGTEAVVWLQAE
jgi:signal transduction histidine kinase